MSKRGSGESAAAAAGASQCSAQAACTVTELNADDVMMGRGASSSEYSGNLRLRDLVIQRRADYCSRSRRKEKHGIAMEIIQTINDRGGRFLQRITTIEEASALGIPPRTQAWKVVEASAPLFLKVKQLMRDVGAETQKKRKIRRDAKRREAKQQQLEQKTGDSNPPPQQSAKPGSEKAPSQSSEDDEIYDESSLSSADTHGEGDKKPAATVVVDMCEQPSEQSDQQKQGNNPSNPERSTNPPSGGGKKSRLLLGKIRPARL